ncbi:MULTISPECIES: enhanced serine sensitivity protein SseB C-terminal domain-containing protein [Kitasatospora]|uniref:enhanced serine sensitivity protein SseB C-terminal domain-containing protein n=1 Tax=Kitasatospora TaxID=2063 RepID=UPI0004C3EEBB|nr:MULTISPECIES: enhanced serine sensitivity protein SseB C-terminal domain-containing protein [unclassified Kitasatospora]WAL73922.1 enhanced serine sensitivity protein SseB C-terminal domain-containing protein [Kitasatospora sp. YST-16]WNW39996.1 enhanced serine sensitivity protein SseB C-terminal domain-containing protein [Streptomyces sp. Li-HN-5-13]
MTGAVGDPGAVERALAAVAPERWEAYEGLLRALAGGQVWMLLWHGSPGSPDAQYGNMDVGGHGYAPCATSPGQLAASGWTRAHEVVSGPEIAASLYRSRWGLWLDPHRPGGGVGVPWADLRRIALGLDRLPAGPLRISEPPVQGSPFFSVLEQQAGEVRPLRSLRRAWVQPVLGEGYLAIGLDLYDASPPSVEAARALVQRAAAQAPDGPGVSTVMMADEYDPVAMWMWANARPFFDRQGAPQAQPTGFGYAAQPPAGPTQGWPQAPWPGYPGR